MFGKVKMTGLITLGVISLTLDVYGFQFNDTNLQQALNKSKEGYTATQGYHTPVEDAVDREGHFYEEGFYTENGKTYYKDSSGNNVTGWQFLTREDGVDCWYYFNNSGIMAKGFINIDGKIYYFKDDGTLMHSQRTEIDGGLYSFSADGHADIGWQLIDDAWYYFDPDFGDAFEGRAAHIDGDNYWYFFWKEGFTRKDGSSGKRGTLAIGTPYEEIYRNGELHCVVNGDGHLLVSQDYTANGIEYSLDSGGLATRKVTIFDQKIEEIKVMFPENAFWNHTGNNSPTSYTWGGGVGNEFSRSWQCNGFAKYIYYYVYGEVSNSVYEIGAPKISTTKVQIGDYVALKGPYSNHSIFITNIYEEDGKKYWEVAREVWGGSNNKIVTQTYRVEDLSTLRGLTDGRNYTVAGIRRARNELRRNVGLADAPSL